MMYDEENLGLNSEDYLSVVTCGACEIEMPLKKYDFDLRSLYFELTMVWFVFLDTMFIEFPPTMA
jgi:hypothetical protein